MEWDNLVDWYVCLMFFLLLALYVVVHFLFTGYAGFGVS